MRYTYSEEDGEDDGSEMSDAVLGARRVTRNSGAATPADPLRPTVTASGRQVRSRLGGVYGESLLSGQSTGARASPATDNYERSDASEEPHGATGRATRNARRSVSAGWPKDRKHIETYNSVDEMEDEEDASSSGGEWDGGDEEEADIVFAGEDDDEDMLDSSDDEENEPKSLIVTLRLGKKVMTSAPPPVQTSPIALPSPDADFPVKPNAPNGYPTALPPASLPPAALPSTALPPTALPPPSFPPTAPPSAGINGYSAPDLVATIPAQPNPTAPVMIKSTAPVGQPPEFPAKQPGQQYPAPVSSGW
jgi:hypothetical protein